MRLPQRVGRLEAPPDGRLPLWARSLAAEVAAAGGLEPEAVIAEAEGLLARAADVGALQSQVRWAAFLAGEGADVTARLAEAERWVGRQ